MARSRHKSWIRFLIIFFSGSLLGTALLFGLDSHRGLSAGAGRGLPILPPLSGETFKVGISSDRSLLIDLQQKIVGAFYEHHEEKTGRKDFEIFCQTVSPLDAQQVSLEQPRLFFYPTAATLGTAVAHYEISSQTGRLSKIPPETAAASSDRFQRLRFLGNVILQEQTNDGLTVMKTEELEVDLEKHTLVTDRLFTAERQRETQRVFTLQGEGLAGDLNLGTLTVQRNSQWEMTTEYLPWQASSARSDPREFWRVQSRASGPLYFHKSNSPERYQLIQEKEVRLTSRQARLTADRLEIVFCRLENTSGQEPQLVVQNIQAQGNVYFLDGQNEIRCQQFDRRCGLPDKLEELVLLGPAIVHLRDLANISVLPAEQRNKMKAEQERRKIEELTMRAQREIRLERFAQLNTGEKEIVTLEGEAYLAQILTESKTTSLSAQWIQWEMEAASRGAPVCAPAEYAATVESPTSQRQLRRLEARQQVHLSDEKGWARGEYLRWYPQQRPQNTVKGRALSRPFPATEERIMLEGHPHLFLRDVQLNDSIDPLGGDFLPDIQESSRKSTRSAAPRSPTTATEDLDIGSLQPMLLRTREGEKSKKFYFKTAQDVRLLRFTSGTLHCVGRLEANAVRLLLEEKKGDSQERILHEFQAQDAVRFTGDFGQGGGDQLRFRQSPQRRSAVTQRQGEFTLVGHAWVQTAQGKLEGEFLQFQMAQQQLTARGNPAILSQSDSQARGSSIFYDKAQQYLLLLGHPAELRQWQTAGPLPEAIPSPLSPPGAPPADCPNTLQAPRIEFWRGQRGRLLAQGGVQGYFSIAPGETKQSLGLLSQRQATPGQATPYRLDADRLLAEFATAEKNLLFAEALGKVRLTKNLPAPAPVEEAQGDRLIYKKGRGRLWGQPASLLSDRNQVRADQMDFYPDEERMLCHGPATVLLYSTNHAEPHPLAVKRSSAAEQWIRLECVGNVLFERTQIRFQQEVHATANMAQLWSQRLLVTLEPDQGVLETIVAHQEVTLLSADRIARGSRLLWQERQKQALLTGSPRVVLSSAEGELESDFLVYEIDTQRFHSRGHLQMKKMPWTKSTAENDLTSPK